MDGELFRLIYEASGQHRRLTAPARQGERMHGLLPSVSLDFMVGQELTQICLGFVEVVLNFHPDLAICLSCDVAIGDVVAKPAEECIEALRPLLGKQIVSYRIPGDGSLVVVFDEGLVAQFFDSKEHYESYTIASSQIQIAV